MQDFQRLFDILPYQFARFPQTIALAGRVNGKWVTHSTAECIERIEKLSNGLLRMGIKKGDSVAMFFHCSSPEWVFFDFALQLTGAIVVPLHATLLPADIVHILKDANIKFAITSNYEKLSKLKECCNLEGIEIPIVCLERVNCSVFWEDLMIASTPKENTVLQHIKSGIKPNDLTSILYTSGTTGKPKGVQLSHANIISNIKSVLSVVPVNHTKTALSFLPLSHVFERMVCYLYMAAGTSIWFSSEANRAFIDVKEVKPHLVTVVPRIMEKVYQSILEAMKSQPALNKKLMKLAIKLGLHYDPLKKLSPLFLFRFKILDLLVFRKWRQMLGGRVEGLVVGAASLNSNLARLFCAAGIPVREGYGLTETSPVISLNFFEPGMYRFGTVGIPIPGVEVKINEPDEKGEGEIWVKGPNVMKGYYNLPEETREVFSPDGWYKTGDVGKFEKKRFLKITDRISDIFKTTSGKFVAPQKVENTMKASRYIQQCMVVGLNRPHVAALIVPDFGELEKKCNENNVHWTGPQYMVLNPKVNEFFKLVIDKINKNLEPHEQVKEFILLHKEWTQQGGELTFTTKLLRKAIAAKYAKEMEALYQTKPS
jgi:long-chain acyl-CoA synthetase